MKMSKKPSNNATKRKPSKLSAVEESQLRCAFSMLDTNHDGRVNADELKCMFDRLGITVGDKTIKKLLSDASKNGNGMISEQEFLKWMSKLQAPFSSESSEDDFEQDLKAAFSVFDRDNNGYITKDDLKSAMQLIGEQLTDQDLDTLLKSTSFIKEGKINYEDFLKILH